MSEKIHKKIARILQSFAAIFFVKLLYEITLRFKQPLFTLILSIVAVVVVVGIVDAISWCSVKWQQNNCVI